MATRAVSTVVCYRAWDTSANAPKTGDSANHTLKWIKDGTSSSTTNSPSEVDSTNAKGIYKVTLTSTETDCTLGVLAGVSSTANVAIFGVQLGFVYANTSAPATAGIPDVNAKYINAVATTSVTTVNANVGTTQPTNFSGTGATAYVKSDVEQWLATNCATPTTAGVPLVDPRFAQNVFQLTTVTSQSNVTFASGASTTLSAYLNYAVVPVAGAGVGNPPVIITSYSTGRVATLSSAWPLTVDTTTYVQLIPASVYVVDRTGFSLSTGGLDAIWNRATSGMTTAGGIGKRLLDFMNGITSLASWLGALAGKTADSSTKAEINATTAGAGYDQTTDSQEALRDRGDAAWVTYSGADTAGTTTLLSRLSATRAGYLDNLSGGAVATSAQLNSAVWAQTRFRFSIPEQVEVPDSSSNVYRFGINTYDANGALADCVSTPTVSAYYVDGTSAAALIGSVSRDGTGLYHFDLTLASGTSAPKEVRFVGTATQGSDSIGMTDYTWIVNDLTASFTSTDRTHLDAVYNKLPANNIADETLLIAAIGSPMQATSTERNKIADHVRRRTQANVEASADGDTLDLSSQYGAIQQMQESSISGTTLTVKKTDGTTTLGTKTLTTNSSANPVTGID